ncbi:MAG: hypothetical protein KBS83_04080 [Lachnospiraceae bacterium]|nr:hypothetical protein [Candidatus Equihabitans merdae]
MNYEAFKWHLLEEVKQQAGESMTVRLHRISRNNQVSYDGLSIHEGESGTCPVIPVGMCYEDYNTGKTVTQIAEKIVTTHQYTKERSFVESVNYTEPAFIKPLLCPKLINHAMNEVMLRDTPHMDFLDLAVVYYVKVTMPDGEVGGFLVKDRELESWGMTQEEVHELALENGVNHAEVDLMDMAQLSLCTGLDNHGFNPPMYVMTTSARLFGASILLNPQLFIALAEAFGEDVLIIPSSIHELIVMPESYCSGIDNLRLTIKEVNSTEVEPDEVLSFNVYRYRRRDGVLEIA